MEYKMEIIRYSSSSYSKVLDFLRSECVKDIDSNAYQMFMFDDLVNRLNIFTIRARGRNSLLEDCFIGLSDAGEIVAVSFIRSVYTIVVKDKDLSLFIEMCDFLSEYSQEKGNKYFEAEINGKDIQFISHAISTGYQSLPVTTKIYRKDRKDVSIESQVTGGYTIDIVNTYDYDEVARLIYGKYFRHNNKVNENGLSYSLKNMEKSLLSKDSFAVLVRDKRDLVAFSYCMMDYITHSCFIKPAIIDINYYEKKIEHMMINEAIINLYDMDIDKYYTGVPSVHDFRGFVFNKFNFIDSLWTYAIR